MKIKSHKVSGFLFPCRIAGGGEKMSWFLDFLMLILIDENHSLSGYGYTNRTMHTRVALAMHTTVLCILARVLYSSMNTTPRVCIVRTL